MGENDPAALAEVGIACRPQVQVKQPTEYSNKISPELFGTNEWNGSIQENELCSV